MKSAPGMAANRGRGVNYSIAQFERNAGNFALARLTNG